ncbi:MAG: type II secretion system F family protein [Alphaproteobacteria bacterium]|nr:type II secretion system F family protein [Alphaproteobacteria bacterium]
MDGLIVVMLSMVFAAIVLAGQGVYFYVRGRRDEETDKIRRRLGVPDSSEEEVASSLLRESAADAASDALGNFGAELETTIRSAGMDMTVSGLVTQMFLAFFVVFVGGFAVAGPTAAIMAFPCAYLPLWWVRRKAAKRSETMLSQMPDALELMGRGMQAGAGLSDCFRLVNEEMPEPIAEEFGRVYDEVRFGKDWRLALEELVARNPTLFELRLLVSSILLQRETGGNMVDTVNRISKLIRQRYAFDAKVRAMTSEARASGFVLAGMPIGVLILIMFANAPYLSPLIDTAVGQVAIVYAVASYGIGIFVMSAMSKVEA